ncbi:unnamed protein product [Rodentolepis nana]|uniref:NARG2_C domain-containing protein n=1 Tax=Rodentolepis nana TaxID=102285 RepID=A0A0R3T2P1_RODNA|nr:unnamed protein product [Rodentolepis nana]
MGRATKARPRTKTNGKDGGVHAIDKMTGAKSGPRVSKRRGGKKTTKKPGNRSDPKGKMFSEDQVVFEEKAKREKTTKPTSNLILINGENKNDSFNLRNEVFVRRRGGLVLSWTGLRVEIPQGAMIGPRNRLISAYLPPPIRAYACPWLGPNLRLGSEIHVVWSPVKLRKPVQIFIPFSHAAVLEMTTPEATKMAEEAYIEKVKAAREAVKEDAQDPNDTASPDATEQLYKGKLNEVLPFTNKAKGTPEVAKSANESPTTKGPQQAANRKPVEEIDKQKRERRRGNLERKSVNYTNVGVPLLDTRCVYVLQSKIGDDFWTIKKGVEIIQPTIHYSEWPNNMREKAYQAGRFSEDARFKSNPTSASSPVIKSSSAKKRTHRRNSTSNDIEQVMRLARDGVSSLEVTKKSAAFSGGVSFSVNDLNHFLVIVIGTPSETVAFGKDGGLLRSPILHPFFSARVPKLALKETLTSTFKAVQVRKDLMESIQHFDNQLTDINECSNIYELDLGNKPFERPVTLTLPLPQWYTKMMEGRQVSQQSTGVGGVEQAEESELQTGNMSLTTSQFHDRISKAVDIENRKESTQMNLNQETPFEERPKNLVLLYQRPFMKRHLVWRACSGDTNSDNMSTKRQNKTGPYRDVVITPMLRGDNMNSKNGWIHLLLGLKGAPWKDIPVTGPFTPRCLQVNTYQLGRFAMVCSNEASRIPSSRVAHLMSRMEALSVAPPGVLVPCLRADPTQLQLSIDCVPATKLISYLEEKLAVGFIPLIQSSASLSRRCSAVANSAYQRLIKLQAETQSTKAPVLTFGTSRYRLSGYDLLRVLLYNGLCIRVVVKGNVQLKTKGIFDCLTGLLEGKKALEDQQQTEARDEELEELEYLRSRAEAAMAVADFSTILTGKAQKKDSMEDRNVPGLEQFITAQETRFSFHDLITDTATVIDLEPLKESIEQRTIRTNRKYVFACY